MMTADKMRFGHVMISLTSVFRVDAGPLFVQEYWDALNDLEIEAVERASKLAIRQCRFIPSPSELRELISAPNKLEADEAWLEVERLARRSSSDHSDKVAAEVMRLMGGGQTFGSKSAKEMEWARKEFLGRYAEAKKRRSNGVVEPKKLSERVGQVVGDLARRVSMGTDDTGTKKD